MMGLRIRKTLDSMLGREKPARLPEVPKEGGGAVIRPERFNAPAEAPEAKKVAQVRKPAKKKKLFAKATAVFYVALPTILGMLYFGFLASNQYSSEFKLAIRSSERTQMPEGLGMLAGMSAGSPVTSDSYILVEYLKSRQLVEDISKSINLREVYGRGHIDWLSSLSKTAPIEDVVEYWKKKIDVHYDSQSGVITAQVRAFTPEDALAISQVALKLSDQLVNELSRRARNQAVASAEDDVQRMEMRVSAAIAVIKKFRDRTGVIDPTKSAGAGLEIMGKFQGELAQLKTQLAILERSMNPNALPVLNLKQRIKAMEEQIAKTRAEIRRTGGDSALPELSSKLLSEFEALELEKQFAQKAYMSSMAALEQARSEALRTQRFLSVFVQPHLPEYPSHPKRLLMMFTVFLASFIGWAVLSLIYLTVKEHIM